MKLPHFFHTFPNASEQQKANCLLFRKVSESDIFVSSDNLYYGFVLPKNDIATKDDETCHWTLLIHADYCHFLLKWEHCKFVRWK